jgi:hypothetical protein
MTMTITPQQAPAPEKAAPAPSNPPKLPIRMLVVAAAVAAALILAIVLAVSLLTPTDSTPPELAPNNRAAQAAEAERYVDGQEARAAEATEVFSPEAARVQTVPAPLDPDDVERWRESGVAPGYYPHGFDYNADDPVPPVRPARGPSAF